MSSAPVSTKGQVVIPKEIRDALGIAPGTLVDISLEGTSARIRPVKSRGTASLTRIQKRLAYRGPTVRVDDMRVKDDYLGG